MFFGLREREAVARKSRALVRRSGLIKQHATCGTGQGHIHLRVESWIFNETVDEEAQMALDVVGLEQLFETLVLLLQVIQHLIDDLRSGGGTNLGQRPRHTHTDGVLDLPPRAVR
eukprot:scaffold132354_cov32-Tisochrysis_lutea.AAC.3